MATAKSIAPVQLEIGESVGTDLKKIESPIQLEIAGIVEKYADAAAEVQKGTVGGISKLQREMTFGAMVPTVSEESPYEALAAGEGAVALVEKDRVALEKEFKPLLEANGKAKYLEQYAPLDSKAKDKIAASYKILKTKGLEEKKIIAATAALIESAYGVRNAKAFIEAWTKTGKSAEIETYTVAPKIKSVGKFAPEIFDFYNVAELEEIDRLQKEVFDAIITQNRQDAGRYKKAAQELEKLLSKN